MIRSINTSQGHIIRCNLYHRLILKCLQSYTPSYLCTYTSFSFPNPVGLPMLLALTRTWKPQLVADHIGILYSPKIIAHCPPHPIGANLHTALYDGAPSFQLDITIRAFCSILMRLLPYTVSIHVTELPSCTPPSPSFYPPTKLHCMHALDCIFITRASRSTCTPRKHYCEMTDNTNAHVASCTCS